MKKMSTRELTLAALFVAITAVLSQIVVPMPLVPVQRYIATIKSSLRGDAPEGHGLSFHFVLPAAGGHWRSCVCTV